MNKKHGFPEAPNHSTYEIRYENIPSQIYWNSHLQKLKVFS